MNISQNLKKQGIEVVVIVGSILLAFGIDSAWDEYQENVQVTRQIQAVVSEVNRNSEGVPIFIERNMPLIENLVRVYSLFSDRDRFNLSEAERSLQLAYPMGTFNPRMVAIEELIQSATYQRIESYEVRYALATYRRSLDILENQESKYQSFNEEYFIRTLSQNARIYRAENSILNRYDIAIPESKSEASYEDLIENNNFNNIIFLEIGHRLQVTQALEFLEIASMDLLAAISKEFGIIPELEEDT